MARKKIMLKPERERFVHYLTRMLVRIGGRTTRHSNEIDLDSILGTLRVHIPDADVFEHPHVHCRFADPDRVKRVAFDDEKYRPIAREMNPYSGKWNHYYLGETDAQACVDDFEAKLWFVSGATERAK